MKTWSSHSAIKIHSNLSTYSPLPFSRPVVGGGRAELRVFAQSASARQTAPERRGGEKKVGGEKTNPRPACRFISPENWNRSGVSVRVDVKTTP